MRAWTIRRGTKAPQAAGVIQCVLPSFFPSDASTCLIPAPSVHSSSDFENKFVCGEIMAYDDLKEHGSETAVKAAGKLRQQGKPYESAFGPGSHSLLPSCVLMIAGLCSGRRRHRLLEIRCIGVFVF